MFTIQTNLAENYFSNDNLNGLIDSIDNTLSAMAICEFNNIRFGFNKECVDMRRYQDLQTYREILLDKLLGCNCLNDFFLIDIVHKIKKLIY